MYNARSVFVDIDTNSAYIQLLLNIWLDRENFGVKFIIFLPVYKDVHTREDTASEPILKEALCITFGSILK